MTCGLAGGQREQLTRGLDNLLPDLQLEIGIKHGANDIGTVGIILRQHADIGAKVALDLQPGGLGYVLAAALNDSGSAHFSLRCKIDLLSRSSDERTGGDRVRIDISRSDPVELG